MSNNARQIDYRLRLAKSVERRMLCSALQKLSVFYPLDMYRYIGFGAYYFSDFYLFHKELGIQKMLSIEKSRSEETVNRYNFNKPFKCIEIDFRDSNAVLPSLEWDDPTIIWLDYTSTINSNILSDVDTFFRNAESGSVFIITLQADSNSFDDNNQKDKKRIDVLREFVGINRLPREIENNMINNKGIPTVYRKILMKEIQNILYERNSGGEKSKFFFKQLFHFKYKDGIPMYTFGGLLIEEPKHLDLFEKIGFDKLPFVKNNDELFEIDIPNLTIKEIKFLESIMPNGINNEGEIVNLLELFNKNPSIPGKDILKFAKIYQYFPTFTEAKIG